ncbi:MAG: hypothetical protein AAFO04_29810, partial [Cyanobacteria bacterium J06592_8]
ELSYGIDWSPVDFEVEKKGLDLTVGGEVGIPGDLLGVSGAVILDLGSGEVKGGEVGIEFGTVDIKVGVEGEDACKKSISIGFAGASIQYTRDDCEEEEEEEEDQDKRKPTGDDTLSGPGAEDVIDDIRRRIQDTGGCSGIIRFRLHDYYLIVFETITDEFFLNLSTGIFTSDYAYDRNDPDEAEYFSYFVFKNSLPYCGPFGCSYMYILGEQGRENFDACMDKLYKQTSKTEKNIPPSPPPYKTKNMDRCCRDSLKMIREIHKVMDTREVLDAGLKVPNRWIAADAKGSQKDEYPDDRAFASGMLRYRDRFSTFEAIVTDVNAAVEGNQGDGIKAVNATAGIRQIVELLLENKGDSATRLNLMVRIALATGQILNVVSIVAKTIEGVVQYIGMPIRERTTKVKMPFDFTFGARRETKGKGFGKNGTNKGINQLNINTEEATEILLPKFMQDEQQPIKYEDYDDRQPGLTDIIKRKS